MKQTLPQNWIVLNSKTHPDRVYYFNVKTNQSSWEEPTADQPEQVLYNFLFIDIRNNMRLMVAR